jgi:hypothetical protein
VPQYQYVLISCFLLLGASRGFPSSTSHLFLHATACGLRRISTPSPIRMLLCCLRWDIKPSASAKTKSRSCTSTSGCATTPTAYRILCLRFARLVHRSFGSATHARLDTGGWLTLTRQGLSPRKMRRALLGAKCRLLKHNPMACVPVERRWMIGGIFREVNRGRRSRRGIREKFPQTSDRSRTLDASVFWLK